jgi:hypothetical protein
MNKLALTLPSEKGDMTITDPTGVEFSDFASIISGLLPYIFTLAGLALFVFLVIGGFGMLTSAGSPDKMKAAQGKITSAIIGFVIIFIAYWLMRILEIIFGLNLLGV